MGKLLVAGLDAALAGVQEHLRRCGHELTLVRSVDDCLDRFTADGADLIVVCLPLADGNGAELLSRLTRLDRSVKVVVCGVDATVPGAAEAFDFGAFEYLSDPVSDRGELLAAVGVGIGSRRGDVQLGYLQRKEAAGATWDTLVGSSAAMQEVLRIARILCERSSRGGAPTVLITGETGTGKGLLAKGIHYNGARRTRPFVEVNCAAIPASLLESELFGHERGAFTDAHTARSGLFETADHGTLFLDEIGNMPLSLQAKLLTAIEEKRVRRIGARQSREVDVQIVAATHVNLRDAVANADFREDLFHRLNVVALRMPPLRERGDDRITLAEAFIAQTCAEYGLPQRRLSAAARMFVLEYPWPGNVRELKNVVERALLLYSDDLIDVNHLDTRSASSPPSARGFRLSLPEGGVALDEIERQAIRGALERTGGNVSQAARFLRVSRQTLMYRMKKHGISSGAPRD